ncbi:hypothetical protein M0R45_018197 [Rubus argutus]|uniref:Uncharacterized protein n=1 Tax=Rubus argutus TaxID=59490 RepID=A0AAW1X1P3_RUBAR
MCLRGIEALEDVSIGREGPKVIGVRPVDEGGRTVDDPLCLMSTGRQFPRPVDDARRIFSTGRHYHRPVDAYTERWSNLVGILASTGRQASDSSKFAPFSWLSYPLEKFFDSCFD